MLKIKAAAFHRLVMLCSLAKIFVGKTIMNTENGRRKRRVKQNSGEKEKQDVKGR